MFHKKTNWNFLQTRIYQFQINPHICTIIDKNFIQDTYYNVLINISIHISKFNSQNMSHTGKSAHSPWRYCMECMKWGRNCCKMARDVAWLWVACIQNILWFNLCQQTFLEHVLDWLFYTFKSFLFFTVNTCLNNSLHFGLQHTGFIMRTLWSWPSAGLWLGKYVVVRKCPVPLLCPLFGKEVEVMDTEDTLWNITKEFMWIRKELSNINIDEG